ncbi:MAG: helix-turn-helix domain-containing protein [Oscillospiraceae bacterium]|nr:helix-turn-helix domain-containing protein [Oscillospiraceae bacterium]MDD4547012.1 helix-turn-helix domain-containing protein [Oscillospiraceae bacterium]
MVIKMKSTYTIPCNIAQTLNLIGDRWTILILHRLLNGKSTYKQLQDSLNGIPSNLLSNRLKSLESDNLVGSELYQEHPPRYRYTLTNSGTDLKDVFNALFLWGDKHLTTCYKQLVHKRCGCKVELRYYCTACGETVIPQELEIRDGQEKQGINPKGE